MLERIVLMMAEKIDEGVFRWILGGLLGGLSTIGGFWLTHLTEVIGTMRQDIMSLGNRQSTLSAHDEAQNKLLDRIDQRFERLEQKIDLLLQEKRTRS